MSKYRATLSIIKPDAVERNLIEKISIENNLNIKRVKNSYF